MNQVLPIDAGSPAVEVQGGGLRPVAAINMVGVVPAISDAALPVFEMVDPRTLLVDAGYQRQLTEQSVKLIRRIVSDWDWRRFKPPVVARTEAGLQVIDGQHTATAAASHPDVPLIPVMVVDAPQQADQAAAFIGHNRDRLNMTAPQLHYAAVAAKEPEALEVERLCAEAGIVVLRVSPGRDFRPRETMAVGALRSLVVRRPPEVVLQYLKIVAASDFAPVSANALKAVEMLLTEPEFRDQVDAQSVQDVFTGVAQGALEREAALFAASHDVPLWRALGTVVFRRCRKVRRRG